MTIDHRSIVWTGEIYNYGFVPDGEGQEGPRFVLEKPITNWMAIYMPFGISIGTALGTSFNSIEIGLSFCCLFRLFALLWQCGKVKKKAFKPISI